MFIKLILSKQMHSPRLYKYQDSVPNYRRALFWYTDTHK